MVSCTQVSHCGMQLLQVRMIQFTPCASKLRWGVALQIPRRTMICTYTHPHTQQYDIYLHNSTAGVDGTWICHEDLKNILTEKE